MNESFKNVDLILNLLNIEKMDVKFTYALDLKLGNIVARIQAHASTFPCLYICAKCHDEWFLCKSHKSSRLSSILSKLVCRIPVAMDNLVCVCTLIFLTNKAITQAIVVRLQTSHKLSIESKSKTSGSTLDDLFPVNVSKKSLRHLQRIEKLWRLYNRHLNGL